MKPRLATLGAILCLCALGCSRVLVPQRTTADGPVLWARTPASPPTRPQANDSGSNIRVNQDASGEDQNETSVAVSPTNPLNSVAAARDRRTQGLEFLLPLKPGIGIQAAYETIRRKVPPIKGDRRFSEDIKQIDLMIKSGELLNRVEQAAGKLG